MKRIIIALSLVALMAPAAIAQKQQPKMKTSTTLTYQQNKKITNAQRDSVSTDDAYDRVKNGGRIISDNAYQPEGTAGVGALGNGTGGSTIGSTPPDGTTGYHPNRSDSGTRNRKTVNQSGTIRK